MRRVALSGFWSRTRLRKLGRLGGAHLGTIGDGLARTLFLALTADERPTPSPLTPAIATTYARQITRRHDCAWWLSVNRLESSVFSSRAALASASAPTGYYLHAARPAPRSDVRIPGWSSSQVADEKRRRILYHIHHPSIPFLPLSSFSHASPFWDVPRDAFHHHMLNPEPCSISRVRIGFSIPGHARSTSSEPTISQSVGFRPHSMGRFTVCTQL